MLLKDYIEVDFTFICVIAGFNAAKLTPKYPDFISERVYALYAAARWWYEYRNEVRDDEEVTWMMAAENSEFAPMMVTD